MYNRRRWILIPGIVFCLFCTGIFSPAAASEPLPDPTRPAIFSGRGGPPGKKEPATWSLTSVLISPERRVAVINGQVVQAGDKVNGAKLVVIKPDGVLLNRAGQKIQLKLVADSVKQAVETAP